MPDMAAFASAFASLKAAGDIAKALVNLRDTTAFQTQLIELQGQILSAQSSALTAQTDQSVLLDRKRELEEEVARLKVWEVEKERYQLTNIRPPNAPGGNAWTYALKADADSAEPSHFLCANCYQEGRKSILQEEKRDVGMINVFFCQRCGAEISRTGVWYGTRPTRPSGRAR